MTYRQLAVTAYFAERAAEGWVVEQRVVPEAVGPARGIEDDTFHHASKRVQQAALLSQGDRADEPPATLLAIAEPLDHQAIVLLVGRMRSGEARRKHSGRAAESVHFQARIIREQRARRVDAVVERLLNGVLLEGLAGLVRRFDRRQVGQRDDFARRQAELAQLAGVRRRAVKRHPPRASCWTLSSVPTPPRASPSSTPSWASSKDFCSAVACTSTKRPEPVMTTFMSTSARESSSYARSIMGSPPMIPTLTAATVSRIGEDRRTPKCTSCCTDIESATKAPVIAAVRVPPSACSTSQSRMMVRSPSAARSTTERSDRPMRR